MKKLIRFLFFLLSTVVHAQNNNLVVTTEENFATVPSNTNMVLVHARTGYAGVFWKLVPNDRSTPPSADVRVVNGSRYRKLSIASDTRLTISTLPATEAPYVPLWSAGNALGKSVLFQRNNFVGVNTLLPTANLDIRGTFRTTGNVTLDSGGVVKSFGETFLGTSGAAVAIGTPTNYGLHGLTIGKSNFNELSINAFVNPGLKIARNGTDGSGLQLEGHASGNSVVLENVLGTATLKATAGHTYVTSNNDAVYVSGKTNAFLRSSDGGIDLRTGTYPGTSRLYVTNSGGVGINTTSVSANTFLEINPGNVQYPNLILLKEPTHSTSRRVGFTVGNWQLLSDVGASGTRDFGLYSNLTSALPFYISQDGKVAIGTASPTTLFDVNSDRIRIRNNFTPTGTADTSGQVGDLASDDNYLYKKTSAGWKRVGAFSTF